jgi:hypothetical protein
MQCLRLFLKGKPHDPSYLYLALIRSNGTASFLYLILTFKFPHFFKDRTVNAFKSVAT